WRLAVARAHRVDRREVEATGEHRHSAQEQTLVLREQSVAPLHRGSKRPLRAVGPAGRLWEKVEQVVEVPRDVQQVESNHPGGGEFNRERKTVDAAADLCNQRACPIAGERGLCTRAGSLLEQAN